jgi:phosphinothricin acetyltransferase
MHPVVRDATEADLERINAVYNQTIVDSHISFDTTPYDLERRRQWWADRDDALECLVAESSGEVIGVCYSAWYRPKSAYRSSVETTIVLDAVHTGRGIGAMLLGALLERLQSTGFHRAVAIVALPNEASIALHHKLGYRTVGTLSEVGHKFDRYWDTMILEKDLSQR